MDKYRRVVVKIGSSTLTHGTGGINLRRLSKLVEVLSDIKNSGLELIMVSSGAIAVGVGKLGLASRPEDVTSKQAVSAVGQCELMYIYDKLFSEYNHTVSQLLLTADDIAHPERRMYIKNTLFRLLEMRCIPVINENDAVAVAELGIGDNDTLSAIVAECVEADLLVLMSDIDGLYDRDPSADPGARLIPIVTDLDSAASVAGGSVSGLGTGGMHTKIEAARIVAGRCDMIILNGRDPSALYTAVEGGKIGTLFPARPQEVSL